MIFNRRTREDRLVGALRIFVGIIFVMTGAMKVFVPMLGEAFAGQLTAANIPFADFNRIVVPLAELGVGAMLLAGVFARLASALVLAIMVVATYVHLVVDDPGLFPLQPTQPVVPVVVMVLTAVVLVKGAGAWSLDLRAGRREG
jgi:putative oxidoreductase